MTVNCNIQATAKCSKKWQKSNKKKLLNINSFREKMCSIFITLVRSRARFCDCWRRPAWTVGHESPPPPTLNSSSSTSCSHAPTSASSLYIDRVDTLRWLNKPNCDLMDQWSIFLKNFFTNKRMISVLNYFIWVFEFFSEKLENLKHNLGWFMGKAYLISGGRDNISTLGVCVRSEGSPPSTLMNWEHFISSFISFNESLSVTILYKHRNHNTWNQWYM